jgi:hypothetical protein
MAKIPPKVVGVIAIEVVLVVIVLVFALINASAARIQAAAQIKQAHVNEISKQHNQQSGWEVKLPEIYAFTAVPGGKAAGTPVFNYSVTRGPRSGGREAVIAEQTSGQYAVDQSDAAIMSDAFKCYWRTPCTQSGTDSAGDAIYSSAEANSFYYYYGLTKGKSVIRLSARKSLSQADVLTIVNSLHLAASQERQNLKVDAQ